MKDLKYYENQQKTLLENQIKLDLMLGPVPVSVDCTIESEEDLENSSVQFSIRRTWRRAAQVAFEKGKLPTHRFLMMKKNLKLNGIPLEDGIILPVFAPEVMDDAEISTTMLREGLILSLQQKFDDYYYRLLTSFDLSDLPEQIQEKITSWAK